MSKVSKFNAGKNPSFARGVSQLKIDKMLADANAPGNTRKTNMAIGRRSGKSIGKR